MITQRLYSNIRIVKIPKLYTHFNATEYLLSIVQIVNTLFSAIYQLINEILKKYIF